MIDNYDVQDLFKILLVNQRSFYLTFQSRRFRIFFDNDRTFTIEDIECKRLITLKKFQTFRDCTGLEGFYSFLDELCVLTSVSSYFEDSVWVGIHRYVEIIAELELPNDAGIEQERRPYD